jgi:hypothetical protein
MIDDVPWQHEAVDGQADEGGRVISDANNATATNGEQRRRRAIVSLIGKQQAELDELEDASAQIQAQANHRMMYPPTPSHLMPPTALGHPFPLSHRPLQQQQQQQADPPATQQQSFPNAMVLFYEARMHDHAVAYASAAA